MVDIHLHATGGLADILKQIHKTYVYAKKNQVKQIYLETEFYNSSNLFDLFDFENFGINFTNKHNLSFKLKIKGNYDPAFCQEKKCIYKNTEKLANSKQFIDYLNKKQILKNEFECFYNNLYGSFLAFNLIKLKKNIEDKYLSYVDKLNIEKYLSIHIRSNDRKHEYSRYGIENINNYIEQVSSIINNYPNSVYIATDDFSVIEKIQKKTNKKIFFNQNIFCKFTNNLHSCGSHNPEILEDAIIDLLILSKATDIITSVGGFSRLAFFLWKQNNNIGKHHSLVKDQMYDNFKIIKKCYYKKIML